MSRYVVDASVAIKWYLPEIHDSEAQRLLSGGHDLLAPDLLFAEVGNILWKRVRAEQMTDMEAQTILQSLGDLPLLVVPSWPLVLLALEIACQTQRTVYDSLYLALAVREQAVLVTADAKFVHSIQITPMARYILWVEDIP
jgi:predicted nucleic acid-binding protein